MATSTKITFTPPAGAEQKYLLSRDGTYTIGSSGENDITLPDPSLAPKHAMLAADETNDSRWFIRILESGSIIVLDNGSQEQIGHTHLSVSITAITEEEASTPEDRAPTKVAPTGSDGQSDKEKQLEALRKVQEVRDFTNAVILIVACGILSFLAGVAWRILQ